VAAAVTFWLGALAALDGLAGARGTPRWTWLVPLAMLVTVFAVTYLRFRAPADPFLVLLAAVGVERAYDWRMRLSPSGARPSRPT
jgi:hypothetical protein